MSVTIYGTAGGENQPASHYHRHGWLTEAHSYRTLDTELPFGCVPVDTDHDHQPIGAALYLEIGSDAMLRAVAVIDDDRLADFDQPIYFSPELNMLGDVADKDVYVARQAELRSLAVTADTAIVGAQPLKIRKGDIRRAADRGSWETSWAWADPLLNRAYNNLAGPGIVGIESRIASTIVDTRTRDDEEPWPVDKFGRPVELRHLDGGLRVSGWRGKILRVS